jgi:uncharacterized protein (TIGR03437 family)
VRVRGLKTKFGSPQVATSLPLPTDFGGVSVMLRGYGDRSMPLPLIRADSADPCAWSVVTPDPKIQAPCADPDAGTFVFQVQIPFRIVVNGTWPLNTVPVLVSDLVLFIQENGQAGPGLRVTPVLDQVHILQKCSGPDRLFGEDQCSPDIYHGDTSPVSASNPARSGETVVAYAYGFGRPEVLIDGAIATSAPGLRLETPVSVHFPGLGTDEDTAVYSGLVAGQVSLYQVNFRIPALPSGLPACGPGRTSNLTMIVRGVVSSDTVSFCAEP